MLMLVVVSFATAGCALSNRGGSIAAYSPGQKPMSRKVAYDATVELHVKNAEGADISLTSTGVTAGTRVGFRHAADGSVVAFVGERPVIIPEGPCEWVIVASSWPRWWSRRGDDVQHAAEATAAVLTVTGIAIGATAFTAAYMWAGGSPTVGGTPN
jgi:hypothetical protein